jgi:hypothetical protein
MPLDDLARHYADELFDRKLEDILRQQQAEIVEVRGKYSRGYPVKSGSEISALGAVSVERTSQLAQARVDSLLATYEKAGIGFDDTVLREITDEMTQFCAVKQGQEISFVAGAVQQTFGNTAPPGLQASVAAQVQSGIEEACAKIARDLRIRRYEMAIEERKGLKIYAAGMGKEWDVFISHASEDKQEFARPLAEALTKSGLSVWYDETALKVGDSLRKAIDSGLACSRFGVVVLSHNFFSKPWPQQELDGLVSRQVEGVKVILPVWYKITRDEVAKYSPMLAGLVAANSSAGLDQIVQQLRDAMGLTR